MLIDMMHAIVIVTIGYATHKLIKEHQLSRLIFFNCVNVGRHCQSNACTLCTLISFVVVDHLLWLLKAIRLTK